MRTESRRQTLKYGKPQHKLFKYKLQARKLVKLLKGNGCKKSRKLPNGLQAVLPYYIEKDITVPTTVYC